VIKLECGRTIDLETLRQEKTYANVLEGMPRKLHNEGIIECWREEALKQGGQQVVVIDPVRKPGPIGLQERADEIFGPPEFLPEIACLGLFQSGPVRNERQDLSLLKIVWFQATWAMPIDSGVLEQIRRLDWENLAYNWTL
jgi:hypothetical protein